MKKIVLIMSLNMLICGITQLSIAENQAPTSGTCNSAGTCLWSLSSDGTMTISAAINPETGKAYEKVNMKNYDCDSYNDNRPWKENIAQIKNIVIGDNIANIGNNAFQWASQLKTVTGMRDVELVGDDAFVYDHKLMSIYMPKVKTLGSYSLADTALVSVDMPNVTEIRDNAFMYTNSLIYIGFDPDKVTTINENAFKDTSLHECSVTGSNCGSCGTDYIMSGLGCVKNCGDGYLGKEGKCIDSMLGCGKNYRNMGSWCNRIRYTPAEAAEILNDDDNEIVITFKK